MKSKQSAKAGRGLLRRLCFAALYGAMIFALKMAMASLPNIEPVTLLVMLAGICLPQAGMAAVLVYVACEILVWGPGLWNLSYLFLWPALFLISRACRHIRPLWFWVVLSALFGFTFGAWSAVPFGLLNGWSAALAWWQAGLPFDLLHGCGNAILCALLFLPLRHSFSVIMHHIEPEKGSSVDQPDQ